MNTTQSIQRDYDGIAWGAFFVWWGVTELFPGLPNGAGALGIGLILVSLNLARARSQMPTSGFTTTLGILALVLGGLELAQPVLGLTFDLPVFAILLIVLGLVTLFRWIGRANPTTYGG
jgi:membrane-bound ClpP family serine protease